MERVRVQYKGEMDTWRAKYEEGQVGASRPLTSILLSSPCWLSSR